MMASQHSLSTYPVSRLSTKFIAQAKKQFLHEYWQALQPNNSVPSWDSQKLHKQHNIDFTTLPLIVIQTTCSNVIPNAYLAF